jgi:hypothetical protein
LQAVEEERSRFGKFELVFLPFHASLLLFMVCFLLLHGTETAIYKWTFFFFGVYEWDDLLHGPSEAPPDEKKKDSSEHSPDSTLNHEIFLYR